MKYEVIQMGGEWIVQTEGREVARFDEQSDALDHVASRLREGDPAAQASLRMRYQPRR